MKQRKPIDKRPKCRTCRDRFVPVNGNTNQKHCLEKEECRNAHISYAKSLYEKNAKKQQQKQREIDKIKDQEARIVVDTKKYRKQLAEACQRLAREIDARFGFRCIDCDGEFRKQVDGGHFKSKGHNATLKYNLHNIHSQRSNCNQNGLGGGKQLDYYKGLIKRYGQWYADYVDIGLQNEYPLIKLGDREVFEKLTIARRLIREFDTFQFTDAIAAREQMNQLLGIYKKSVYSYRETKNNEQCQNQEA